MTFNSNTPNPSTSTTTLPYGYKAALLSILISHMVNELTPTKVWSIVEHSMTDISKVDPELNARMINIVHSIYRDKTAPTNSTTVPMSNPSVPTTTPTTDSKESNLKGDNNATRKEATMATTNTTTEAGELIANFIKNSLGDNLPKEYNIITGIVEAIPVISKAVKSALDLALIRAILSGDYPQLLNLERDGNTISNVKAAITAFTNNKDEVTINDLIKFLKYGSYDCHMDEEGRIAATLLYIKLYNK